MKFRLPEGFDDNLAIAVIGMAGRFPNAKNVQEFWENLKNGNEAISFFSTEELAEAGVPADLLNKTNYVKAAPVLDDITSFDAGFFGYTPREAATLDPQQRVFLECAWHALENAGYDPETYPGLIGVFAGSSINQYLLCNLLAGRPIGSLGDLVQFVLGNDKDYLTTRVSYKLNLRGPSLAVQTACSTSLVAVHLACQSLVSYQCDMALAGGVTLRVPQKAGYCYQDDMIFSPDGHCRPFDARAGGTIFGSGVGLVVLKRLADAIEDGDRIDAVIRGSAINNDGSGKIGYTAPGLESQADVIAAAQAIAGVRPETISAVEAHGTGTQLGDPIEMAALNRVFMAGTDKKNYCALGSVKSNVGHLEAAAGVTGFIKMSMALKHKTLPPSLHFAEPNPQIDFANSPFFVNTQTREWPANGVPRRAGVSSFGMGGTNAHVILQEAPALEPGSPSRPWQLLMVSAKTLRALDTATANLAAHLKNATNDIADLSYTLNVGRQHFKFRRVLVCQNAEGAVTVLEAMDPRRVLTSAQDNKNRPVTLMFPGQGTQYPNMGRELYDCEPTFRHWIDTGAKVLLPHIGLDLRKLLYPAEQEVDAAAEQLSQTAITQPALFMTEYALAMLLAEWGIRPHAMIGHSIGEYVAACLAGVFSFEDALAIVAARGQLIGYLSSGSMISLPLPAAEVEKLLNENLSLAAINAPALCTVSGTHEAIAELEQRLGALGLQSSRLHTSHAFHSAMMDPILSRFHEKVSSVQLKPPQVPFVSNLSGTWITAEQATDPDYWVRHMRNAVQFSLGITEILKKDSQQVFLEVGPGQTLSTLSRQHTGADATRFVYSSMRRLHDHQSDVETLLTSLGRLWLAGIRPDWKGFYTHELRRRVELPTYPFARHRFWVEPDKSGDHRASMDSISISVENPADAEAGSLDAQLSYLAPRNELEEGIAVIWRKYLGIERISIHGNFFELNGHSLVATQVLAQIANTLNARVSLRRMLEDPTIAGLAEAVREALAGPASVEEPATELPQAVAAPEDRFRPFPLMEMQQAQWIGRLGGFNLGDVAAHVYFETEGQGLDVNRLADTWRYLIDRHDMLRAVVHADGQQQVLEKIPRYEVKVLDLRGKPKDVAHAEILSVRERMSHQVRPADVWPLFEVCATQLDTSVRMHLSFDLLVSDIGSIRILMGEWSKLYQGLDLPLPELEISFRDYVLTEAKLKETPAFHDALQYWQERVAKLPPGPDLPMTQNIATVTKPKFVRLHGYLEHDVWNQLKARAARARISPSAVVLSAFGQVLGLWSKSAHFCVNGTILNRWPLHHQVRKLVGEFASFAPVEMDLSSEHTFEEFARQVQIQSWESLEHRYVSGVRILREIARIRGGTAGGTLPIVFTSTLVAAAREEYFPISWLGEMDYLISQTPQVWFDHSVFEEERGLLLNWILAESIFPAGMVEEMFGVYEKLLRRLGQEQEIWQRPTRELLRELLPKEQVEQRVAVNATEAPVPQGWLHSRFAEQARQRPQQMAVITPTRSLSYAELFHRANQLAHRLRRQGVQPNQLVAVAMEKGWEQVVGVLGILTAGAAYLPVDPTLPQERIEYLLEHGQARIVLSQQDGKEKPWLKPELCQIVIDDASLQQEPASWLEPVQKTSDLAYVIYTSGSTGLPKGVMISHEAALNTVVDVNQRFSIGSGDRVFGLSSLSFDLSVYDIFGTLAAGATLVLPRGGSMRDPAHWAEIMTAAEVTVWNSVPALMEMLVEYADGRQVKIPLRLVMLSGDWIPVSLPGRLWEWIPGVELISMGGATEAAIWSILYPVKGVDPAWESIPYGKPMVNQRFHVLNEALEACPVWVPGQLHIAGIGLAEGYWRDPERTASSFFTHPRTGERLYRTGDLGRYLPDGNIEFLGREDFQVKVHGHRIELGEIEAALTQHPLVRTALVTAQGKDRSHKRLVGYVVPNSRESAPAITELREFISAKLPEYMVPTDILMLDELPLSSNGKVDRRALPLPDAVLESDITVAFSATLTEKLKTIYASVLGVPDAGIHTNFFEMGGDSILGIQIINRAREQGIDITPQQIFEHQTIAELVAVVRTIAGGPNQGPVTGDAPLTPFQRWILTADPGFNRAAQVLVLQAASPLDFSLLERSFRHLQQHHDALRLRYHKHDGQWRQTHAPENQTIGITRFEAGFALDSAIEELQQHLDLSNAPLALGYIEQDRPLLVWLFHELLADQHSWSILLNDLSTAYGQLSRGEPMQLPHKTASFQQWAETVKDQIAPSLEGQSRQPSFTTFSSCLDAEQSKVLLGQALLVYNIKIQEILVTALAQTFVSQMGALSLALDIEDDGRKLNATGLDCQRLVGCFTALSSLELNLKDVYDHDSALKSVKEQLRRNQNSGPGKSRTLFSYLELLGPDASRLEYFLPFDGREPARTTTVFPHPLQLRCTVTQSCLEMHWTFDPREHQAPTIRKLSDAFCDNLQNLIQHCQASEGGAYLASDFPEAEVSQEELDKFLGLLGKSSGGGL
jgi:amino acid adenylation domain-containing protein/non-ribosomal peptide synthase protein (TIGR01720 family)